jgi:hypothetical protein
VFRAYTSLSKANSGDENDGLDNTLESFESWSGGKDIVTSNEQWNIAAYADSPDTSGVIISGWEGGLQNYLKIFTPVSEKEVGISQRHSGYWNDDKFVISKIANSSYGAGSVIKCTSNFLFIDGLQISIDNNLNYSGPAAISLDYLDDEKIINYEKFPRMDWQIKNETKKIEDYVCNKATTFFRGRNYTAWYSTDIPIKLGPWKFNGLPGAILQIYDETGSFSWSITKIKQVKTEEKFIIENDLKIFDGLTN